MTKLAALFHIPKEEEEEEGKKEEEDFSVYSFLHLSLSFRLLLGNVSSFVGFCAAVGTFASSSSSSSLHPAFAVQSVFWVFVLAGSLGHLLGGRGTVYTNTTVHMILVLTVHIVEMPISSLRVPLTRVPRPRLVRGGRLLRGAGRGGGGGGRAGLRLLARRGSRRVAGPGGR